jgi:hypothetical protein
VYDQVEKVTLIIIGNNIKDHCIEKSMLLTDFLEAGSRE